MTNPSAADDNKEPGCFQIGCGGLVLIFLVFWIIGTVTHSSDKSQANTATTSATSEPNFVSQKANRHEERQRVHEWWDRAIGQLAFAEAATQFAATAIGEGDEATASQLLKRAAEYAKNGQDAAMNNVPDGWDDIARSLSEDEETYVDMVGRMRTLLDDGSKPSMMADLKDELEAGTVHIGATVHNAHVRYAEMGGSASELSNGSKERDTIVALFKLMTSHE